MKIITIVIALVATLPGALSAQRVGPTAHVAYKDLDLNSAAGAKTLDQRIAAAAQAVCPETRGTGELARVMISRRCTVQTIDAVKAQRDRVVAASARRMLANRQP